jgi:glycosyltransferase involved in cell wall biosynthesis
VHLVIVGARGWKNKQFHQYLSTSNIRNRIVMPGYASRPQLKLIYQKAAALVFPSLYEGFGLPILEAMSCGTPVITSRTASMAEVAGDAAILVDPHDIEAIANAMHKFLTDPTLKEKLVERGFQRLGAFSWEKCALETMQVLNQTGAT